MDSFVNEAMEKAYRLEIFQLVILVAMEIVANVSLGLVLPFMILSFSYYGCAIMVLYLLAIIVLSVLSFAKMGENIRKVARVFLFGGLLIPIVFSCALVHGILTGWLSF